MSKYDFEKRSQDELVKQAGKAGMHNIGIPSYKAGLSFIKLNMGLMYLLANCTPSNVSPPVVSKAYNQLRCNKFIAKLSCNFFIAKFQELLPMTTKITYITGDATYPTTPGNKIITHICNDIGAWGKGFVMAISKRWKEPAKQYKEWFTSKQNFSLGEVQFVQVETGTWVANMIGQHKIKKGENGNVPIRYEAVLSGLHKVAQFAIENNATVHMPRIGCGLAGGTWDKIEPLIENALLSKNVPVTVYDFS